MATCSLCFCGFMSAQPAVVLILNISKDDPGPRFNVSSDRLVKPGIELGTLGTRRMTYPLHNAGSKMVPFLYGEFILFFDLTV